MECGVVAVAVVPVAAGGFPGNTHGLKAKRVGRRPDHRNTGDRDSKNKKTVYCMRGVFTPGARAHSSWGCWSSARPEHETERRKLRAALIVSYVEGRTESSE